MPTRAGRSHRSTFSPWPATIPTSGHRCRTEVRARPAVAFRPMALRDRFWTPKTAKAILSWRIALGAAVGVVAAVIGVPAWLAAMLGAIVYVGLIGLAMPSDPTPSPAEVDPFTVGEPWRRFVQNGQRSRRRFQDTVRNTRPGPLHDRLQAIATRLDAGLQQGWQIARRGHEIDAAVKALDPTRLRSRLATLEAQAATEPSDNLTAAIKSVQSQLATADRLKALSASTADQLRLNEARLDELCARAAEVSVGSSDPGTFASDVDDLVLELEGMRQALQELPG